MFVPQLSSIDETGTDSRDSLSAVGSEMLSIVQDSGPSWFRRTFSVVFLKVGSLGADMSTIFNGRFPSVFVQFSFDFTQLEDRKDEVCFIFRFFLCLHPVE